MLDRILFRLNHLFNHSVSGGNSIWATHVDGEQARGAASEMPDVFTEVLGPTEQKQLGHHPRTQQPFPTCTSPQLCSFSEHEPVSDVSVPLFIFTSVWKHPKATRTRSLTLTNPTELNATLVSFRSYCRVQLNLTCYWSWRCYIPDITMGTRVTLQPTVHGSPTRHSVQLFPIINMYQSK